MELAINNGIIVFKCDNLNNGLLSSLSIKNLDDLSYKIVQIEINGEKLLDENSKPIDPKREYTCAIDNYIGNGEQGFEVLANIQKIPVTDNAGKNVKLKDLLLESLKIAQNKYSFKTLLSSFSIQTIFESWKYASFPSNTTVLPIVPAADIKTSPFLG